MCADTCLLFLPANVLGTGGFGNNTAGIAWGMTGAGCGAG